MKASKFTIALLTLITLTVGFSTVTLANEEPKKEKAPATELKFIGNLNNSPVFELSLINAADEEIIVTFRDDAGNVVYANKFKGTNITKKFLLQSEGFSDASLSVTVKSLKNNTTDVYAINRSQTYVEETVVNKLKQ